MKAGIHSSRTKGEWARRHVPLLIWFSVGMLLLVIVLPSALNLPQSNPSTIAEYAPVPPDDSSSSDEGNLASLGIASSRGLGSGLGEGEDQSDSGQGRGRKVSSKRCVGRPLRQTEDPMSPPCVAFFEGNNGGATYQGVTGDEVRLLLIGDGGCQNLSSSGLGCGQPGSLYDVNEPKEDDPYMVRILRTYQRYFNDRYQTYDRFVHFFVYYEDFAATAEKRRASAAEASDRVKPFAAFDVGAALPHGDAFVDAVAKRGILNFSAGFGRSDVFFRRYPNLLWGYPPTVEQGASRFAAFVCRKVVGHPVSFSGMSGDMGDARRLGFLYTNDPAKPEVVDFAKAVKRQVEACGGTFVEERTNPSNYCIGSGPSEKPEQPALNMAAFQAADVTTIIWAQCWEMNNTHAAAGQNYFPEWVIAGDRVAEAYGRGQQQSPEVMAHSWIVSDVTLQRTKREEPCFQAQKEADPNAPDFDVEIYGCSFNVYESLRQLFTGIQVAGPRLSPTSMARGFRSIPARASTSPTMAACFYGIDDYSCVKDSISMWWDPQGRAPGAQNPGCWRVSEGGRRVLEGDWDRQDVNARKNPSDPCNGFNQ